MYTTVGNGSSFLHILIWMSLLCFNQRFVTVNIVHDALVKSASWWRLFRYFSYEKVKAVGHNNNLEATKKDDDQSNATGVANLQQN